MAEKNKPEGEQKLAAPVDLQPVLDAVVALEVHVPNRGALVFETRDDDGVLGWSWLIPPYRWHFDARALVPTRATALAGSRTSPSSRTVATGVHPSTARSLTLPTVTSSTFTSLLGVRPEASTRSTVTVMASGPVPAR